MITSSDQREEIKKKIKEEQREMPTDNTGVQTRAMAQCTDSEPQETQNQNVNPTVELYKSKDESIKDFVQKHGTIALDWYVPNFRTEITNQNSRRQISVQLPHIK